MELGGDPFDQHRRSESGYQIDVLLRQVARWLITKVAVPSKRCIQRQAPLLREQDHVGRIPRALGDASAQESGQDPAKKGSGSRRDKTPNSYKGDSGHDKERWERERKARRMRDEAFRPTAGCRPAASWYSSQPHERLNMKCLREQVEHVHLCNFVADRWPRDFFRFPG
jgi:hypothetical protein